jgi:hypothetical protein
MVAASATQSKHMGTGDVGKEDDFQKLATRHASDEDWTPKERKEIDEFARKNKISQLNVNLGFARMAIQFVRQKIQFASNDDMLQPGSYDNHFIKTGQADPNKFDRDKDACVNIFVRDNDAWRNATSKPSLASLQQIRLLATSRSKFTFPNGQTFERDTNCGNCNEQAAIAFTYLHRLGVRPLDYCTLTPFSRDVDHVFVIIGRRKKADPKSKLPVWEQWDDDAVVCDPWTPELLHAPGNTAVAGSRFGASFGAYQVKLLRTKLAQIFPGFTGVNIEHTEA